MRTLELENYGVMEMNDAEQREADGGNPTVLLVCAVIGAVWAVNEMSKDFMAGWNAYKP